jgi:transketolase
MRKTFADTMISLANKDDKLVVLIGDISHYLLKDFETRFPDRFYNVGICEQSMISMAAGLAIEGYRPVVHTIAPFCVERAYEQIKVDVCYQNLDVTIVSVGGSFDYAHLGCTHHCYEDISILRPLPNIDIYSPGNKGELITLLTKSWNNGRPKYFKLNKTEHTQDLKITPGELVLVNEGLLTNPLIIATGHLLDTAMELKNHTVMYCHTIEPMLDKSIDLLRKMSLLHKSLIVLEENSKIGALGDKITDIVTSADIPVRIKKVGLPREFCLNYGTTDDHRKALGIDHDAILEMINVQ